MSSFGPAGVPGGTWQARSAPGTQHGAGWEFLGNPYQEKALKLQEEGQKDASELARAKFGWQQGVFNQLSPFAMQMMGQAGPVGGQTAPQPHVNTSPLYSAQQIQQQVNAGTAQNDQRTATLMKQLMGGSAARGFGGQSPALQAQQTQLGIANMGENARTAREVPMQFIQGNADQAYRTDRLLQDQWAQGQDVDIRRRQSQLQAMASAMGLLGQFA